MTELNSKNYFELSIDPATQQMLAVAEANKHETVWDRNKLQQPHCKLGLAGICCKICNMGPCRISPKSPTGTCGANSDIIVARNLARAIAAGAAAHSDHGRVLALILKEIAEGKNHSYTIRDEKKLRAIAKKLKLNLNDNEEILKVAELVSEVALRDFSKQDNEALSFLAAYAAKKRLATWKSVEEQLFRLTSKTMGLVPRNIDREVVDIMHRTNMGVDSDPLSLLAQAIRVALADGWGGSLIASELQDVLFGTPSINTIVSNLGVIDKDYVNIVVHGHEAVLSEKIVEVASSKELNDLAKSYGAKGVNIIGMCCTCNELLMRKGVPVAGNVMQQELAIMTGAVELIVVDVQCIYPSLGKLSECYHTKFVTTSEQAAFPKAIHIQFDENHADETAKRIIRMAIEAFPNRTDSRINIPSHKTEAIVGFSVEEVKRLLGDTPEPLINAIVSGKIKGIVGMVGCNNPKIKHDHHHVSIARELIKRDILVIGTGCWAIAAAKAELMQLSTQEIAGPGLREVSQALGIPPVLHMGSCVDCSRMLSLASWIADFMNADISALPLVGSAPEWMSEKAQTIGTYFISSGIPVHLCPDLQISGSPTVQQILFSDIKNLLGGFFFTEFDPVKAVDQIEAIILERRKLLGI